MKQFVILALVAVLFASCQKETSVDQSANTNSYRVKTYTESIISSSIGNSTTTFNVNYDNSGKITSMVSAASPGDKFVYSFPSNTEYAMDLYNAGTLSIHEEFYLNAASLVDSTFQYNDTEDTMTEKYTYDLDNRLVQLKEYDYSKSTGAVLFNTTGFTYDAGGHLVKTADTDGETHTYEYYPDLSYASPLVTGIPNARATQRMNLVKKHTLSSGNYSVSADYTYTFDDKNRISTEKAELSDGSIAIKTYTYY